MARLIKVQIISEIEKHLSIVSENAEMLPYLRKDILRIMLDVVSNWSEELNRLRTRVDSTEKEKKIGKRKRAETV